MHAAEYGHLKTVLALIEKKAYVNQQDTFGNTALMLAAMNGRLEIAEILIAKGANVNQQNNFGYTALMRAADYGHLKTVLALIENGADVNQQDTFGHTALMLAARYGHFNIVQELIINGADVNPQDCLGYTALMYAIITKRNDIAQALIEKGADVNENLNLKDNEGNTALMLAVIQGPDFSLAHRINRYNSNRRMVSTVFATISGFGALHTLCNLGYDIWRGNPSFFLMLMTNTQRKWFYYIEEKAESATRPSGP